MSVDTPWRELIWWMALKLMALFLLWFLFFSPAHRAAVDSATTGHRFALDPAAKAAARVPQLPHEGGTSAQKEKTRG
jgi:hypothetical protein